MYLDNFASISSRRTTGDDDPQQSPAPRRERRSAEQQQSQHEHDDPRRRRRGCSVGSSCGRKSGNSSSNNNGDSSSPLKAKEPNLNHGHDDDDHNNSINNNSNSKSVPSKILYSDAGFPLGAGAAAAAASSSSSSSFLPRFDEHQNKHHHQQQPSPLHEHDFDQEENTFELMQVSITIYSLFGVLCRIHDPKQQKQNQRRSRSGFGGGSRKVACPGAGPGAGPGLIGLNSSISSSTNNNNNNHNKNKKSGSNASGGTTGTLSSSESSQLQLHRQDAMIQDFLLDDRIPTTAVVSTRRNVYCTSGTSIETFLPSKPFKTPYSLAGSAVRFRASWDAEDEASNALIQGTTTTTTGRRRAGSSSAGGSSSSTRGGGGGGAAAAGSNITSTFKMIRIMRKESYRPSGGGCSGSKNIAQISNYVPETIDLNIFIGHGTELLPMGIASLAITGDEEGEVYMSIPAKRYTTLPRDDRNLFNSSHGGGGGRRRRKRSGGVGGVMMGGGGGSRHEKRCLSEGMSFSHDPKRRYSLDDNATIRVGVRVLPQAQVKQAGERVQKHRVKQEKALEEILDGLFGSNNNDLVIELNDENSLIERYMAAKTPKRSNYCPGGGGDAVGGGDGDGAVGGGSIGNNGTAAGAAVSSSSGERQLLTVQHHATATGIDGAVSHPVQGMTRFFCGGLEICNGPVLATSHNDKLSPTPQQLSSYPAILPEEPEQQQEQKEQQEYQEQRQQQQRPSSSSSSSEGKKVQTAVILPPSLLSSVSESYDDGDTTSIPPTVLRNAEFKPKRFVL